jgi:hypothetical protein
MPPARETGSGVLIYIVILAEGLLTATSFIVPMHVSNSRESFSLTLYQYASIKS